MSLINIRSSVTSSVSKFLKKQEQTDGASQAAAAARRDEPAQLSTGFICPECMQSFFTAQGLSVHFEEAHGIKMDGTKISPRLAKGKSKAPVAPSVAKELLNVDVASASLEQLRSTIVGLRQGVKEERLYSTAVKQQMEQVDVSASRKVQMKEEELKMVKKMFEEAEESRMKASMEVEDLKSVIVLLRDGTKEKVVQKAAELAIERANLRSKLDDTLSRNIGLDENVNQLQANIIAGENNCRMLQVQLDSRPQNDDVEALRQEMGRLHQTMDSAANVSQAELSKVMTELQATKEELSLARQQTAVSEERGAQGKATADASAAEVKRLEVRCHDLRRGLDKAPTRDELTRLSDANKDLQRQLESAPSVAAVARLEQQCASMQKDLDSRPTQSALDSQTQYAVELKEQLSAAPKSSDLQRLQHELDSTKAQLSAAPTHAVITQYEAKVSVLQSQLETCPKQDDLKRLETELSQSRSDLAAAPKPDQLASLQSSLGDALSLSRQQQEQLQSKDGMVSALEADLRLAQGSLAERESALLQIRDDLARASTSSRDEAIEKGALQEETRSLQRQLNDGAAKLEQVREELAGCKEQLAEASSGLARFETERKELIAQIEAGEGTGAAIQQLTQDKEALYQQRIELESKLQAQLHQHVEKLEEDSAARNALLEEVGEVKMKCASLQKDLSDESASLEASKAKVVSLHQEVQSQVSEIQTMQRQKDNVDNQLQQSQAQVLKLEKELQQVQNDLKAGQDQISVTQSEVSGLRADLASGAAALAEKKELIVASEQKLAEMLVARAMVSEQLQQSQRQLDEMKASHTNALEQKESELVELRTQVKSLQLDVEGKRLGVEKLQQSCNEGTSSLRELEAKLEEQLEAHSKAKAEHEDALTRFRLEKESLEAESVAAISSVRAELESKVAAIAGVQLQLDTATRDKSNLQAGLADKEKVIAEKLSEIGHLSKKLSKAQEMAAEKAAAHQQQISDLEGKVAEVKQAREVEQSEKVKLSVELETLKGEQSKLEERLAGVEKEKQSVHVKLSGGEKEAQGLKDSLQARQAEVTKVQEQLAQAKRLLKESKQKLQFEQEKSTAVQTQLVDLDTQLRDLTESSKKKEKKFSQDLEAKETVMLSLQQKLEGAQAELKKPCQSCQNYERQVCRLQAQLKTADQTGTALRAELDGARTDFGDLNSQIDTRESQLAVLEKKSSTTITQLNESKATLTKQVRDLSDELKVQKETLAAVSEERDQVNQLLTAKEAVVVDLSKTKSYLEKDVATLTQSLEKERAEQELDTAESKKARDLFVTQKVEQQHELDAVKKELNKQTQLAIESKAEGEEIAASLATQLSTLRVERERAEEKRSSVLDEMSKLTARHHMNIETLNTTIQGLQAESSTVQVQVRQLKAENDRLLGDVAELDCAVSNFKDERILLLERCITSEEETETLQGKVVVLRKQVDDATAALHDMGQLAQTLQVDVSKQSERSWEADKQVTNCKRCKVKFSVTVRKHHCRNCGSIFCQPCASRSAQLPSIKKPARVCDGCYRELNR